ncbi:hypothetical protein K8P10_002566 [Leucobacter sp. Psy1]|uniref:hypothetical protein n=1 Tax=Leucobacter sp. Psy1 TaxID=2875729 RepID=UPI001CD20474|nr:hypothetical protein [Leucobacter sp. Psy1]UBH07055.1 hypothetical protein K8P10_002566 [Leucobacter sp. Psy1]
MKQSRKAASLLGRPVVVADLMELATIDSAEAHTLLTSMYQWKYEYLSTAAKAVAGAGSAVFLATLVPVFQAAKTIGFGWGWIFAAWAGAIILVFLGGWTFILARKVHAEFVAAQSLLAELIEVRPFLRAYRERNET